MSKEYEVTLTEKEISTILYHLEKTYGYLLDGEIPEEVQTIFSKLEGVMDVYAEHHHKTWVTKKELRQLCLKETEQFVKEPTNERGVSDE